MRDGVEAKQGVQSMSEWDEGKRKNSHSDILSAASCAKRRILLL